MAVDRLPAAPEVATQTLQLLERDNCNLGDLAAFLASDQAMAAGLLRLANSALFGLHTRITSLAEAVRRLGFNRVRDLVLGLSVWESFDGDPARRYIMWLHSALVASTAKVLAEQAGRDGGEAFTAGVVHDVGRLVLGLRLGAEYWSLVTASAGHEVRLVAAELEAFGCHHGTVGGWLFQLWKLPPALAEAAAHHHDKLVPGHRLDAAALVGIANRLVDATDPTTGTVEEDAFREVQCVAPGLVTRDGWPARYARIAQEQQAVASMFG